MSIQIAVRLPEDMVEFLDKAVAEGSAPSRTALVASALEREMRRMTAQRDAALLAQSGSGDDLDPLVDWSVQHAALSE